MNSFNAKIDRKHPAARQVYAALRQAIIKLDIGIGQALSENEVAANLGVSRTPVREAFIKLAGTGLIEILPQRGTFVVTISPAAVRDAQFVREALEVAVVRAACLKPIVGLPKTLRSLIERQRLAADASDFDTFLTCDEAFHEAMAEAVGHGRAWQVIETEKGHMDRVRYLSLPEASTMHQLIVQHEAIVDALEQHNIKAAEAAIRLHLSQILRDLEQFRHDRPELFESSD